MMQSIPEISGEIEEVDRELEEFKRFLPVDQAAGESSQDYSTIQA